MNPYERLYHDIEANNYLADEMTIWVGREAGVGKAEGYVIYDHRGIDKVRDDLCGDVFKIYAIREDDYGNCDPASIENHEVVVNFFGYFITEEDLDWAFKETDWQEVYDWDYDPWNKKMQTL